MKRHSIRFFAALTLAICWVPLHADWEWNNPEPAGNDLFALSCSGTGRVAMGGDAGMLLEHDGSGFSAPGFNTYERINDIHLSGNSGVAVCERGDVLLRDATGWSVNGPETTEWFYGAAISPTGDVWVCGDLGKIYRYDGLTWENTPSNTSTTLKDVEMYDDSHGWAVGLYGTARIWNGTAWQYFSSHSTRFLRKVSASGPDRAWVVGDLGTILMWNGSDFIVETSSVSVNLFGVLAINDTDAWAVGDSGTILHRTDSGWNEMTYPELPEEDFRSIDADSDGTLWLAGKKGLIAHFDGTSWNRLDINDIEGNDLNDILYHPGRDLLVTAGTDGHIWSYDGVNFLPHTNSFRAPVNRLAEDPDGNLWAVCDSGVILKNTGGTTWSEIHTGDTANMADIDFVSSDSIWTAGGFNDGTCDGWTVLHYDSVDWTIYTDSGS